MRLIPLTVALVLLGWAGPADAQSAENVLLVVNSSSPASVEIGEYYANARSIPPSQVVRLEMPTTEFLERDEFQRAIETPIGNWLLKYGLQDQILYIVLTKGVPLRVLGTGGLDGTTASVDSELTLLYRRMLGENVPVLGRVDNPYYLADRPPAEAGRFTRHEAEIYLVTRLDGYSVADVRALIDRGLAPSREGRVVLDLRAAGADRGGDRWLQQAADRLEQAGAGSRLVFENTQAVATATGPVIGYYSWGSNDASNRLRGSGLTFASGAVGGMFVSTDGRTFHEPPADWRPGPSALPLGMFGSGSQSMAADLIREGLTGVSAHVAEPYLDATVRPQILLPAYLAGSNLAESFYLALPYLSWQTMIVGDPLVAPFAERALEQTALHSGMDEATGLPAIFASRRLARLAANGLNEEALKLVLRADVLFARDEDAAAEALLAKAAEIEPKLVGVQLRLAAAHETRGEWDAAIDRYRQVVAVDPRHVVALNNLAYALAERKGQAKEALPFAQEAFRLSNRAPVVADTLGWIHHLLGDDRAALPLLELAVRGAADTADVQFHAAVVHAALGQLTRARQELDRALALDPSFAERDDVKELRRRLGGQ